MSSEANKATFESIVRPHLDRLYRLAFRLTGHQAEAEDLFQELLIKAFGKLDDLVNIEEPGSWLARIMYNLFIDEKRRFARQRMHVVEEAMLPGEGIAGLAAWVVTLGMSVLTCGVGFVLYVPLLVAIANVMLRKLTSDVNLYWSDEIVRKTIFFTTYVGCIAAIRNRSLIRIDALPQLFPFMKKPHLGSGPCRPTAARSNKSC